MANSNIAGYDITYDPFAPNLLHDTPTPEGEADLSASASVDDTTGTPAVTVTKTKTGQSTYNFDFAFTGLKGEQGEAGETGPQGPQGPKGDDGEAQFPNMTVSATVDSATGSPAVTVTKTGTDAAPNVAFAFTGLKGETGATGPQGERGLQGETGAQGPQGIQGIQGETGPAGSDGVTPAITADGTVDSNTGTPSVEVTKTGTDAAPVFHFAFHNVKGDQGIPGTGTDGVGITSIDYTSTDAQGNNVYTITLSNGQTYDFTANRGPAGETGATGPQGPQGEQGIQGIQGIQGETGPAGATGSTGATGNGIASIVFKETDASGNNVYTITMTDSSTYDITCPIGPTGIQGPAGETGPAGPGVPTGGTAGQVLSKVDGTDYNCQWINPPASGLELLGTFTLTGETKTFNITQSYQWGNQGKAPDPFSLEIDPDTFKTANPNISSTTITATKDIPAGSPIYLVMGSKKSITPYIALTTVTFTNCLYGVANNSSNSRNYLSNDARMYLMKIYNATKRVDVTNNVAFRDTGRIAFDLYSSSRAHNTKLGSFEILVETLGFITESAISEGDVLSLIITHSTITPHRGLVQPELIPSALNVSNPPYASLTIVGSGFNQLPDPISLYV